LRFFPSLEILFFRQTYGFPRLKVRFDTVETAIRIVFPSAERSSRQFLVPARWEDNRGIYASPEFKGPVKVPPAIPLLSVKEFAAILKEISLRSRKFTNHSMGQLLDSVPKMELTPGTRFVDAADAIAESTTF